MCRSVMSVNCLLGGLGDGNLGASLFLCLLMFVFKVFHNGNLPHSERRSRSCWGWLYTQLLGMALYPAGLWIWPLVVSVFPSMKWAQTGAAATRTLKCSSNERLGFGSGVAVIKL